MKCVADQNIPLLRQISQHFSQCIQKSGPAICADDLRDADVLLVRSVTAVDTQLLSKARHLKFVASATAGVDHIDTSLLTARGIHFYNAKGCNASAVVDYVMSALKLLQERGQFQIQGASVGVIGVGEVGTRLTRRLSKQGVKVVCCDPPRQRLEGNLHFSSLEVCLACDVVSFHVPLILEGCDKTYHLLNAEKIARLDARQILINAARGKVWDNQALLRRQRSTEPLTLVMDVWEHEPKINRALLDRVAIATPHIAGYTQQSKIKGAVMVHQALVRFFRWNSELDFCATENRRHTPAHLSHQDFLLRQQYQNTSDFDKLRSNSLRADFPIPTT